MRMTIDQSREQRGGAQVDDFRPGGNAQGGRSDLLDLVTFDQNSRRGEDLPAARIEQSAGFHQSNGSSSLGGQLRGRSQGRSEQHQQCGAPSYATEERL